MTADDSPCNEPFAVFGAGRLFSSCFPIDYKMGGQWDVKVPRKEQACGLVGLLSTG